MFISTWSSTSLKLRNHINIENFLSKISLQNWHVSVIVTRRLATNGMGKHWSFRLTFKESIFRKLQACFFVDMFIAPSNWLFANFYIQECFVEIHQTVWHSKKLKSCSKFQNSQLYRVGDKYPIFKPCFRRRRALLLKPLPNIEL